MGTLAGNYYGGIVKDGLVLMLDAAKKESYDKLGTTWRDISWNGNNGTLTNFGGQTTWDGGNGGSIVFDGTNDVINLNNTYSNIVSVSLPTSYEIMVYANASANNEAFIGSSYANGGILLRKTNTNVIRWLYIQNGGNAVGIDSTQVITSGWYHIIATYNGNGLSASNFKLYINGVLASTTNFSIGGPTSISTTQNISVGGVIAENTAYLNGKVSIVRIYNRLLTSSEILQNYNATKVRYFTPFNYFIVAGGGSAGGNGGGGGGAGGLLVGSGNIQPNTTLTATVGSGGVYPAVGNNSSLIGGSFSLTATGGGRGTTRDGSYGTTGGSGAGGAGWTVGNSAESGFAGVSGQGNSGGNGTPYSFGGSSAGGGGGGYGSAGTNGSSQQGGNGGNGYLLSWNNTGYAGGGAGSGLDYSNFFGRAGTVQSGYGGGGPQNSSGNGRVNSGGGGGSLANATNSGWSGGGAGGSGIVILQVGGDLRSTTGNPIITNNGSYYQYVFSGTGTITI